MRDYARAATLLHPMPLNDGGTAEVKVVPLGERSFRLEPWPLREKQAEIEFPARFVEGKTFGSNEELRGLVSVAKVERLMLRLSA